MKKSKIEIIDETVEFYSTHPRSVVKDAWGIPNCVYQGPGCRRCAVARCADVHQSVLTEQKTVTAAEVKVVFLEEYEGHSLHFWRQLQCLHDDNECWRESSPDATERQLSIPGLHYVDKLKAEHA